MRILWVKMGGLWPPTSGGRVRSLEMLSCLTRRHEVTVLTTHGPDDDTSGLAARLPGCRRVISVPFAAPRLGSASFARALARSWLSSLPVDLWKWRVGAIRDEARALIADGAVDLCVADFLVAVPNIPRSNRVPLVLFEHNVEYMIWRRIAALESRPWRRALLEIEWRKVRRIERLACSRADITITVSEEDQRLLQELAPDGRCVAVPTGVDAAYFAPGGRPEVPHRLVFTGSMDWHPNEDAILHFSRSILPRIRAQVPDVTITVAGRTPSAHLREVAGQAGIVLTGTVDDVRPYIDEAAVYIVPLRAGGGTRLKIFEALAMAKAVVSTTVGAEGLALTPDRDVCIADEPEAFAATVIALLRDPARRHALGRAGRQLVEDRYSWDRVAGHFDEYCQSAIARADTRTGAGALDAMLGRSSSL
ncbi:MAG TPA: glycosyltransferase family 4 protein [Vicinamibacterales bacterium]|nr:glycosyltransferase family 4 protein [Vicinamibacterales bacterium]